MNNRSVAAIASALVALTTACNKPASEPASNAPPTTAQATKPADATPKADAKLPEYPGPLGMKFGASPEEVKTALKNRFKFVGEETQGSIGGQIYTGPFAGLPTEQIQVLFCHNKFAGLTVIPQANDGRSLSARWSELVGLVEKEYGKPSELKEPNAIRAVRALAAKEAKANNPSLLARSTDEASREAANAALDRELLEGTGEFLALWRFANERRIIINSVVSPPNKAGTRFLHFSWDFADKALADACIKEASADKDF